MIQLQEMLLQNNGDTFYILPCWDNGIDVSFRLYAPGNTVIECDHVEGQMRRLEITSELPHIHIEILPMSLSGKQSGTVP